MEKECKISKDSAETVHTGKLNLGKSFLYSFFDGCLTGLKVKIFLVYSLDKAELECILEFWNLLPFYKSQEDSKRKKSM